MTTDHTPALAAEGMDLGALEEQSAAVLPPKLQAVIDAASEWWSERTPDDWDSADLAKAVIRLHGDWLGCPGCDFQCGEPCTPATEAEQLHAVDCHIAQLVHDGKLHAGNDYKPPEGWTPEVDARKKRVAPPEPQAQAVLAELIAFFGVDSDTFAAYPVAKTLRMRSRLMDVLQAISTAPPPVAPAPAATPDPAYWFERTSADAAPAAVPARNEPPEPLGAPASPSGSPLQQPAAASAAILGAARLDPNEADPLVLWAEIARLKAAIQGPAGFASWQDAAVSERVRRVRAERALTDEWRFKFDELLRDYVGACAETAVWNATQQPKGKSLRMAGPRFRALMDHIDGITTRSPKP